MQPLQLAGLPSELLVGEESASIHAPAIVLKHEGVGEDAFCCVVHQVVLADQPLPDSLRARVVGKARRTVISVVTELVPTPGYRTYCHNLGQSVTT